MSKLRRLLRYDWPLHFVLLLTNWLPDNSIFLKLRGRLATPFFGHCGRNLKLQRCVTFYNPEKISIGSNVRIAYGCRFVALEHIKIGDKVIVGPYCIVISGEHTRFDGSFRDGVHQLGVILVNNGVWIASHVTVTSGSIIGQGTLIGANSVVRGKLPDNVLAAGQPAVVKKHFR